MFHSLVTNCAAWTKTIIHPPSRDLETMAESSSPLPALPTLTSIVIPATSSSPPAVVIDEEKDDSPQEASAIVDLSKSIVKLPMDLVKEFDVAKTWPKDSAMAMLIKNPAIISEPQFVLAMELSMLGVIHGSDDSTLGTNDDSDASPWINLTYPSSTTRTHLLTRRREKKPSLYQSDEVAMVGNYNRVYHSQLLAMLAARKVQGKGPLHPVTIVDDSDESGGQVPQLRSNMFFIVPVNDWSEVEVAVQRGKATLIALDRQDMDEWMRMNVVGVDVCCLKQYLGTMTLKFRSLSESSPTEFAQWLDQAALKVKMAAIREEASRLQLLQYEKMIKTAAMSKKRAIDALSSGDDGNGQLVTAGVGSTTYNHDDDRGDDDKSERDSKRCKS